MAFGQGGLCEPTISVACLTTRHGLNPCLLFEWCRAVHAGEYYSPDLLPVSSEDYCSSRPSNLHSARLESANRTPTATAVWKLPSSSRRRVQQPGRSAW